MLAEIRCEIFSQKSILFHNGLNVVLGDNDGANSIGKSSMLMIIDFIFGGNTYITHNSDVVRELGHHEFQFVFVFKEKKHYFKRNTSEPAQVHRCDSNFNNLEIYPLKRYTEFLSDMYELPQGSIRFREAVSLYSRIWGKHNLDVKRPLHTYPKEKNSITVQRFLALLNEYDDISEGEKKLKILKESQQVLRKAVRFDFLPKVTKTQFEKNKKQIFKVEAEIEKVKSNIHKTTVELSEKVSSEIFNLQTKKNDLIIERDYLKSRLLRINKVTT